MTAKKVFHIISHFDVGGAERVAVNIAKSKSEDYEYHIVEVIRADSPFTQVFTEELKAAGIHYHRAHMPQYHFHFMAERLAAAAFPLWFLPLFLKHRPAVIHTHTEVPDMAVWLFFKMFPKLTRGCKLVRTIHSTQLWTGLKRTGRTVEQLFIRRKANIAISQSVLDNYADRYGQSAPIIYNGVGQTPQKPHEGIVRGKTNILFAGRFEPYKGIKTLIETIKRLADDRRYHFHLIGDGSMRQLAEQELGGTDCMTMYPPLHGLPAYLSSFDYLFMPSEFEGLSIMSLEASMERLPVIANDCPGLSDTLPDDWPLKVKDNSIDQYMNIFKNIIPNASADTLGDTAHAFAAGKFGIRKMQTEYEKVYG